MTMLIMVAMLAAPPPPSPAPRARDLGIPFDFGRPGPHNAITDVPGVEVGHVTLVAGRLRAHRGHGGAAARARRRRRGSPPLRATTR